MRNDGRKSDQFRPVKITKDFVSSCPGSVLIEIGKTKVLCTASIDFKVPAFLKDKGQGWITAEYGMLPGSTSQRKPREIRIGRVDGRTYEIQRLIGRAMRAVVDLELLGEKTIWLDCDVLEADGGTRTAAITGGFIALVQTLDKMTREKMLIKNPIRTNIAAVSVGRVKGKALLDLSYEEDSRAEVDLNVVMTETGELVEVQGTAEGKPFSEKEFLDMLELAKGGVAELIRIQKKALES